MKAMKMYKTNDNENKKKVIFFMHFFVSFNFEVEYDSFDEVNPGTFDCLRLAEVLSLFKRLVLSFPLC